MSHLLFSATAGFMLGLSVSAAGGGRWWLVALCVAAALLYGRLAQVEYRREKAERLKEQDYARTLRRVK